MRTIHWCCVLLVVTSSIHGDDRLASEDEKLLAKHAIALTSEGVSTYLKTLLPDSKDSEVAAKWIAQLSDPTFAVRESAMRRLVEMTHVPVKLLQTAAESADLETATRAKAILHDPRILAKLDAARGRRELTAAVLRTIGERKIHGTTSALLEMAPHLDDNLLLMAGDAAARVALPDEAALLRKSIADRSIPVQIIALRGLSQASGDAASSQLRSRLKDANPQIALAAAHSLAERGDRACVEPLVRLATADPLGVRVRAVQILRAATKQSFGENPYRSPNEQQSEFTQWKTWLAQHGASVRLNLPLKLTPLPEDLSTGLLLHYTFNDDAKGRLIDASGHGRHGGAKNAIDYVARGRGKAIKIEGRGHHGDEGGFAEIPFIDFEAHKQFSLAIWVYETGMTHEEGEAYVTFGIDRDTNVQESLGIAHLNTSVLFRVGDGHVSVPFAAADRGRWVHYAMTFADGRLTAYKQGESIAVATARVSVPNRRAALGRHWWSGGAGTSTRFQGAFDDLRVYDRPLTPQQIRRLFSSTTE